MRHLRSERGDTLIEVILSLAIFALVTVSMFSIMQRVSVSALGALERTQARMKINQQTELLHYLRDQYIAALAAGGGYAATSPAAQWVYIEKTLADTSIPGLAACTAPAGSFFVDGVTTGTYTINQTITTATTFPEIGKGLWVQKVEPNGYNAMGRKYLDFYVQACWQGLTARQTLSSIVRLYVPQE